MKAKTFMWLSLLVSLFIAVIGFTQIYESTPEGIAFGSLLMTLSIMLFVCGMVGGAETRIIRKLMAKDTTDLFEPTIEEIE